MKIKFLFALVVAGIMGLGSTSALANDALPLHYHVGEVQLFQGLMCKEQESAMHIFNTWVEVGVDKAQKVFLVYQNAEECTFLSGRVAFFVEEIASENLTYFDSGDKKVLVFSVSPVDRRDVVDFLVTWEDLGEII